MKGMQRLLLAGSISANRLCERSAAIHTMIQRMDCRVASLLAKTNFTGVKLAALDMKAVAIMVLQTSKAKSKAIPFAEFAADIERRRLETGVTELPRNSGKRRTESKKALLAAIEEAGGKW